ncbi:unnamed protein product [Ambrosiozyma monospora]|uniref:Unnamed protein product n=1 Tax=Ambrosiozyma monospora TaxID=43982 RepID=A0ACB5STN6_AMBMO|nr:unnamed protein product [Ambrosiozyma monospora]
MDDMKDSVRTFYWSGDSINMSFAITALKMVSDHKYGEYDIVNFNKFSVPNEFERIMFAVKILQNSKADDEEIELAITKFRKEFNFFTLTYGQQGELLGQKLLNDKHIFDSSSLINATILTAHIQYSSMLYKSSPISTEFNQLL